MSETLAPEEFPEARGEVSGSSILVVDNVSLTLGSKAGAVDILNGVSLRVSKGESIGIVGRSGSGKSSLLSLLAGLEKPTAGRIMANSLELNSMNEEELARFRRQSIGFVFQSFHLIPTMTALENAALPIELSGEQDAFDRAAVLLAKVGLGERIDHYPDQLSGGEQQRVAIVRAVIGEPSILLADDPTGNLDVAAGGMIADMLFEFQSIKNSALVLVTHDQELAARCDRVVEMVDGHLVPGLPRQVTQ